MKKIILLSLFLVSPLFATPVSVVADVESHIMHDNVDLSYLKRFIDDGMNAALNKAIDALNEKGEYRLSQEIQNEWAYRFHRTLFMDSHDIGDHLGISTWINDTYRKIEQILGRDFCVESHIAAMLTFNSANVVVKPCSFPMDQIKDPRKVEYNHHFAGRNPTSTSKYNGVVPEASYFAMELACLAGTSGAGSFVCSVAAGIAERLMSEFVASPLSDYVFDKACGGSSS